MEIVESESESEIQMKTMRAALVGTMLIRSRLHFHIWRIVWAGSFHSNVHQHISLLAWTSQLVGMNNRSRKEFFKDRWWQKLHLCDVVLCESAMWLLQMRIWLAPDMLGLGQGDTRSCHQSLASRHKWGQTQRSLDLSLSKSTFVFSSAQRSHFNLCTSQKVNRVFSNIDCQCCCAC